MSIVKNYVSIGLSLLFLLTLSACAPEIGSKQWCEEIKEKPKADWSTNDATDFAKHCILK